MAILVILLAVIIFGVMGFRVMKKIDEFLIETKRKKGFPMDEED